VFTRRLEDQTQLKSMAVSGQLALVLRGQKRLDAACDCVSRHTLMPKGAFD